jgi:hypothetical protein
MSTVSDVGATWAIRSRNCRIGALLPIITGDWPPPLLFQAKPLDVEGLLDVIEGPMPHGFNRRGDRGMRRDHHHLHTHPLPLDVLNELQSRHAWHLQIGDDNIERIILQNS